MILKVKRLFLLALMTLEMGIMIQLSGAFVSTMPISSVTWKTRQKKLGLLKSLGTSLNSKKMMLRWMVQMTALFKK